MSLLQSLLARLDGRKSYLASALLAVAGVLLLYTGSSTLGLILLANGGGVAALRHALAKLQAVLADLEHRLPGETEDRP
jgi:hypothetical protein